MRMGVPRVLLSDNGTEFCNKINDTLNELLGIKKRLTTPYHPQVSLQLLRYMCMGCLNITKHHFKIVLMRSYNSDIDINFLLL